MAEAASRRVGRSIAKRVGAGLALSALAVAGALVAIALGLPGDAHPVGTPVQGGLPSELIEARTRSQLEAARRAGVDDAAPILFGDLHVHTTFSIDAYQMSMPDMGGEGLHPLADACDYARYCSGLDFWSINDHAEGLTPAIWEKIKQGVRDCNAVTDAADPDVVAFLGFEWTQAGSRPDDHYGHKNVVFRDTAEDRVPRNPIAADNPLVGPKNFNTPRPLRAFNWLLNPGKLDRYLDYNRYVLASEERQVCPQLPYSELPADCIPFVATPAELFRLLRGWGGESIVIPHGNTWGLYTPAGTSWDKQLAGDMHDPDLQILAEIFSGHGNSEEYRSWREVVPGPDGEPLCPEDRPDHVTGCQRAGEIVYERCMVAALAPDECARRRDEARENFARAGATFSTAVVPGTDAEDWLDAEQCTDCYMPSFRYRPGGSYQYAAAIRNFDAPGPPRRFDFGFIGSSDNHQARPGTGYKEVARTANTESGPGFPPATRRMLTSRRLPPEPRSRELPSILPWGDQGPPAVTLMERQSSFFFTGGLVAAHSEGRTREEIWSALKRRAVYATSGRKTLLWFDLLGDGPDDAATSMGSTVERAAAPRFRATAIGDFVQEPGCPDHVTGAMTPEELAYVCRGECDFPSEERNPIERIEVIRIRPQVRPDEPVEGLIEDPWQVFECIDAGDGCSVEFTDRDFEAAGRDALYYVRAVEAAIPTINAGTLRVEGGPGRDRLSVNPCLGGRDDDCLALENPQAWSSPIFVEHAPPDAPPSTMSSLP